MKNLKSVTKFIDSLVSEYHDKDTDSKRQKKIKKELPYYKLMAAYIQSAPTKEYLDAETGRLNGRLQLINDMFEPNGNLTRKEDSARLRAHNKVWNVGQLKNQLKAIKYILS